MDWLNYQAGELFAENVPLQRIAEQCGTPTFVYSRASIVDAFREFRDAARGRNVLICYALKANPNLAVIDLLAKEGAGFDIVSGGELARVLAVGGDPKKIIFSGVGKSSAEIDHALEVGVGCFNVESIEELHRLSARAQHAGKTAKVSLRVNPNVDAKTHPYISTGLKQNKFGIAHEQALSSYQLAASLPMLEVVGIDCHIGSQITDLAPFMAALEKVLELMEAIEASGIALHHLDLGGGLGISYEGETPPSRKALFDALFARIDQHPIGKRCQLMFEFGRSLVGNAGALLTRIEYLKPAPSKADRGANEASKSFAIVDAAMNDLMRPALYQAYHGVTEVRQRPEIQAKVYDIVGPVCESGDWLAKDRTLKAVSGDLLAFKSAGAYGMSMSSNYNSRSRAVEVMVDGDQYFVIRQREKLADLFALEAVLPNAV
jgi:diaminopimelate decarboxylase